MEKEILEGNKLIAEFMELWYAEKDYLYNPQFEKGFKVDQLRYDTSWDWLIPVIDKATSMNEYPGYVDHTCSIVNKGGIYINTHFISVTWENVVDFIEWYNQNK